MSCSQKRKDLPYIADSSIVDSQHDIRTVIGLDTEYTQPFYRSHSRDLTHSGLSGRQKDKGVNKLATISYWTSFQDIDENGDRVGSSQCLLEHEAFRSPSGLALPGSFEISICAFLPNEITTILPIGHLINDLYVIIPHARLAAMLEEAEGLHEAIQKRKSVDMQNPKPKKWLKRKRATPKALSAKIEANCRG